jgi:antitoxin (DNA-binding transcriptional repressor) of toxin-antitoxin stability system
MGSNMVYNMTMLKVNINAAKTHLSKYLQRLRTGREDVIVLCNRNVPVAEIRAVPVPPARSRPVGLAKGRFDVPESFFAPLPDDLAGALRGEGT